jgi:hypothetical protein
VSSSSSVVDENERKIASSCYIESELVFLPRVTKSSCIFGYEQVELDHALFVSNSEDRFANNEVIVLSFCSRTSNFVHHFFLLKIL